MANKVNWLMPIKTEEPILSETIITPIKQEKTKKEKVLPAYPEPKGSFNITKVEPIYSLKKWGQSWNMTMNSRKVVLVEMELNSGDYSTFIVVEKEGGFTFKNKQYTLNPDMKRYNWDAKMYFYRFHEDLSLPVDIKINVKKVKDSLTACQLDDIEYALSPSTLKKFLVSKVIEMILKGAELDKWMRMMFWICLFSLIASAITLIVLLGHAGVFDQIFHAAKSP